MRFGRTLFSAVVLAVFVALVATGAHAQNWWVQSADYGSGNQRHDVTNTVRRLVKGPNFRVNNQTMGGDPARGKDKTLRIVAKDSRGQVRDFKYGEGSTVNSPMFAGGPGTGYPGWGGGGGGNGPGWNNGGNKYGLRITSAKWGFGASQMDVTRRLQDMVRNDRINVKVTPQTMGGDPSRGNSKILTVYYEWKGRRDSKVTPEGAYLQLP